VVLLTLVIGVLNVLLGFAAAVYLGFGPPGLMETWEAITGNPSTGNPSTGNPSTGNSSTGNSSTGNPPTGGLSAQTAADEESINEFVEGLASSSLEDMLDTDTDGEMSVEPYDELYDDDAAELMAPDDPENWELDEKLIETSILKLNIAMMKSGARATDIDTRLRECRGSTDTETIETCLAMLREDCETYLSEQNMEAEKFSARIGELGELQSLGEEIELTNLEQASQVETTLSNLEFMDFSSDLEAANLRLLEEINNLRVARHNLRDNQEVAFLAIARYENRLDDIEQRLFIDPLTKIRNRIGVETTLHRWWTQGRHKSRPMNAMLFDLDVFGEINKQHGCLIGDKMLCLVSQFMEGEVGKGDLVGRFAGQRFLVLMFDVGPQAAVKTAEMLRQSIAKISFRHAEHAIKLTTAVGVAEVSPEDTEEKLFARLGEALAGAKKAGGNKSFVHDGKKTEEVESPDLKTKPAEFLI